MDFRLVTYFANGFLMIFIPLGLAIYLTRKFNQGWRLFWIGAATFIVSQVFHIPFNALVNPIFTMGGFLALSKSVESILISVFLGLSAGLFEELSRYAMYRWWAKDARSWNAGLLAGVGHGGIEAIILGIIVLYGYFQMLTLRGINISMVVTPDKVDLVKSQVQAYWSAPLYMTLLGAVERLFTIPLHLACSVLVLQNFIRKQFRWVGFAILLHALVDGVAVFLSQKGLPALIIEGIIGLFAVVSVVIVLSLRKSGIPELSDKQSSTMQKFTPLNLEETNDNLDRTKFD